MNISKYKKTRYILWLSVLMPRSRMYRTCLCSASRFRRQTESIKSIKKGYYVPRFVPDTFRILVATCVPYSLLGHRTMPISSKSVTPGKSPKSILSVKLAAVQPSPGDSWSLKEDWPFLLRSNKKLVKVVIELCGNENHRKSCLMSRLLIGQLEHSYVIFKNDIG